MFDLGFGELLMIALVALVVLGPERLPKAARFAGLWVRRARAQWYSVRSELERELAAEELKRNLDAVRTASTDFERQARSAVDDLDASVRKAETDARGGLKALRDDLAGDYGRETRGADNTIADGTTTSAGTGSSLVDRPPERPAGTPRVTAPGDRHAVPDAPARDGDRDGRG
jgi:sec-independent protein translocase protein TatB